MGELGVLMFSQESINNSKGVFLFSFPKSFRE